MKLKFETEAIRQDLIRIQASRSDLYQRFDLERCKLKDMDYGDFLFYIKEELGKSDANNLIKEITKNGTYEFRLPPKHTNGVLRVEFELGDDMFNIVIKRVWIKTHTPKKKKIQKAR